MVINYKLEKIKSMIVWRKKRNVCKQRNRDGNTHRTIWKRKKNLRPSTNLIENNARGKHSTNSSRHGLNRIRPFARISTEILPTANEMIRSRREISNTHLTENILILVKEETNRNVTYRYDCWISIPHKPCIDCTQRTTRIEITTSVKNSLAAAQSRSCGRESNAPDTSHAIKYNSDAHFAAAEEQFGFRLLVSRKLTSRSLISARSTTMDPNMERCVSCTAHLLKFTFLFSGFNSP